MPIITNHRGPSFREYNRTPVEKKTIELESRIAELEKLLSKSDESTKDSSEQQTES